MIVQTVLQPRVMFMIMLNDMQLLAAANEHHCVFIEAIPGSGKTVVAVERFGIARYVGDDERGVLAIAFNVAAVALLKSRIQDRWGSACLSFPHNVCTFDRAYRELIHFLILHKHISWSSSYVELDVREDYRDCPGYRDDVNVSFRLSLDSSHKIIVVRERANGGRSSSGFESLDAMWDIVRFGVISYDDLHSLIDCVRQDQQLSLSVTDWLRRCYRSIIVDEAYDMNLNNLWFLDRCFEAGLDITIVGDPWQSLYMWRDAVPELIKQYVEEPSRRFVKYALDRSYRFESSEQTQRVTDLREGGVLSLENGVSADVDVVLASQWSSLWHLGNNVVPLSFGKVVGYASAVCCLLLNELTLRHFGLTSPHFDDAVRVLKLSPEGLERFNEAIVAPVLSHLEIGGDVDADLIQRIESDCLRSGFLSKELDGNGRAQLAADLRSLSLRLQRGDLVPGMTVNQAKGREWDRVGVWFSKLPEVLDISKEYHRKIYVAVTRSRFSTCLLKKIP